MQLVMGLGNPGEEYLVTRHNVGFRCVEAVAAALKLTFADVCPAYRAAVGDGPSGPVTLLEPLTYMNRSGLALAEWSRRTGCLIRTASEEDDGEERDAEPQPIVPVVVCDDIQLPLGSVRIRAAGSDGGQNGLASVIATVGHRGVPRLRLGIGPLAGPVDPADWADYVLAPFDDRENEQVDELIARGRDALLAVLELGPADAASRHNRRVRPSESLPDDA